MIRRWFPQSELGSLRGRFDRVFDDFLGEYFSSGKEGTGDLAFFPPVDIKENKESINVTMEIPGVKKDDISIEINDNILSIRGHREFKKEEEGETHHRIERSYGSFVRSFSLSCPVEKEKIEASYRDGLLALNLPKCEEAKPKKIAIKG